MATKKITKVETPIDQRETFVSLQKTFADSDLSVEEKLKTLYELQKADTEIDKILQLRGELPGEVAALEKEIADMKDQIEKESAMVEGFNANIAAAKEEIVELDAQIVSYRGQLENISNSREYDSISKEVENLDLLRQIAEKKINESKNAILDRKARIEDIKDRISMREEDLEAKQKELEVIVESTSKEEAVLHARRKACAEKIDARTISAYDRIRASVHNRLAVVSLYNGDSCGGCFSTVTPQRRVEIASNKKLIICEHCGRIIVNPDFE